MRVALFVPCYVDQFYPNVAIATLSLLEKLGVQVDVPMSQTCCGQPMANAGRDDLSGKCTAHFTTLFGRYEYVVSPSGSCVLHLKHHSNPADKDTTPASMKIFELSEFLIDVLGVSELKSRFPFKVGFHQSCHALRGLHVSKMSELMVPAFSKPRALLDMVRDIELVKLTREDECCGFGGTFCISEEAVSVKMGTDRISDHLAGGAQFITGTDMSCLMHLEGLLKRMRSNVKILHFAEILNSELP